MEVKAKGKDPNSEAIHSDVKNLDIKLGGNIVLVGFSLDPAEMIVVKKIVGHYAKKISEKVTYTKLKVILKQTHKAEYFSHEVKANVFLGAKTLSGESTNNNLYTALSAALNKAFEQASNIKD